MTAHAEPSVEIYSTSACPDCHALKGWLAKLGVPFIEHDLTRPEVADEAKTAYPVCALPHHGGRKRRLLW